MSWIIEAQDRFPHSRIALKLITKCVWCMSNYWVIIQTHHRNLSRLRFSVRQLMGAWAATLVPEIVTFPLNKSTCIALEAVVVAFYCNGNTFVWNSSRSSIYTHLSVAYYMLYSISISAIVAHRANRCVVDSTAGVAVYIHRSLLAFWNVIILRFMYIH